MKTNQEMTIKERIEKIGSLNSIDQAMRLVEVLGGTVCGYSGTTVETVEEGTIEFKERNGRICVK